MYDYLKQKGVKINGSKAELIDRVLACVASVSNRVICAKVRAVAKKRLKGEGEGEGRRGNACPQHRVQRSFV